MKSVVVGAVMRATFAAAVPVSAQVVVRDRDDLIIRDHEHGWNRTGAGIATMPNATPCAFESNYRMAR